MYMSEKWIQNPQSELTNMAHSITTFDLSLVWHKLMSCLVEKIVHIYKSRNPDVFHVYHFARLINKKAPTWGKGDL